MRYLLLLCTALFLASCAPRVYETAAIDTISEKHTTIAVIKPKVDYLYARPKKKSWSSVPDQEAIAEDVQAAMINWVRERQELGVLSITVIDVETTNKLLAGASSTDYSDLARELGVDVVMVSRLRYDTRIYHAPGTFNQYDTGESPASRIYLNLFTAEEGLIWSYEHGGHNPSKNYDRIVFDLLRNAAGNMPYAVAK